MSTLPSAGVFHTSSAFSTFPYCLSEIALFLAFYGTRYFRYFQILFLNFLSVFFSNLSRFFCGDSTVLKLDPQSGSSHENRYHCTDLGQRKCNILIGYTGDEKTGKPCRGWQGKPKISHNKKQHLLLQDPNIYDPRVHTFFPLLIQGSFFGSRDGHSSCVD